MQSTMMDSAWGGSGVLEFPQSRCTLFL